LKFFEADLSMLSRQDGYIHRWFAGKKEKAMSNMELQETDYKWFLENYKMLYEQYGVSYLAIKNKTVLGSYSSYAEALHETEKSEPIGSFIIQYCNGNETGYTNYISSMFVMGA
jgi:hypothetical protein